MIENPALFEVDKTDAAAVGACPGIGRVDPRRCGGQIALVGAERIIHRVDRWRDRATIDVGELDMRPCGNRPRNALCVDRGRDDDGKIGCEPQRRPRSNRTLLDAFKRARIERRKVRSQRDARKLRPQGLPRVTVRPGMLCLGRDGMRQTHIGHKLDEHANHRGPHARYGREIATDDTHEDPRQACRCT